MTLLTKLFERFRDSGYRHAYVDSFLNSYIATQIKVLREQQGLTQTRLAMLAEMKQSQISAMEDVNHSSWKVGTLKKIAKALDLVLVVRFESFGNVLPDIDQFGRTRLQRDPYARDAVMHGKASTDTTGAALIRSLPNGGNVILFASYARSPKAFQQRIETPLGEYKPSGFTTSNYQQLQRIG